MDLEGWMEFGVGIEMAHQMRNVMHESLQQGKGNQMSLEQLQHFYYVLLNEAPAGPFSEQELSRLISEKQITKETYIWRPGLLQWKKAMEMPEVLRLVVLAPPPPPVNQ